MLGQDTVSSSDEGSEETDDRTEQARKGKRKKKQRKTSSLAIHNPVSLLKSLQDLYVEGIVEEEEVKEKMLEIQQIRYTDDQLTKSSLYIQIFSLVSMHHCYYRHIHMHAHTHTITPKNCSKEEGVVLLEVLEVWSHCPLNVAMVLDEERSFI